MSKKKSTNVLLLLPRLGREQEVVAVLGQMIK